MIEIENLSNVGFNAIYEAFSEAFNDYEITLNRQELQKMLNRRGFDANLSFAAFSQGKIVSFTFNGIGSYNGQVTAYDTGTGTIKEFRGQGLPSKVFYESIGALKEAGVTQYLLEVLQHNEKAISVYKKLGFEVSCEFNYFVQETNQLTLKDIKIPDGYVLKPIDLKDIDELTMFWDFAPSWQNSFPAIFRSPSDFIVIGVLFNGNLIGYGIFEPASGDITQLAVHRQHRRIGIGTTILSQMVKLNKHTNIKAINTEVGCENVTRFFEANGLPLKGKQFEMINREVFFS